MSSIGPTGQHGGDGRRVAARFGLDPAQVLDLSASLNPFAPPVAELLVNHVGLVTEYPDPEAGSRLLAEKIGVDPRRFVLTNGGAEAIALVAQIVEAGTITEPEFSLYRRHLPTVTDSSAVAKADNRWRSNPNNPMGALAAADDSALVWDEAFYPLATGRWTRGDEASWRLGSLTKLWSCPGLRLGYVIAPTVNEADAVRQLQPRWAVNGLALGLIPELLALTDLTGWAIDTAKLRDRFVNELKLLGLEVSPSSANWVLLPNTRGLKERLAPAGIIVRDCASFGLSDTHRVALPSPDSFDRVVSEISRSGHR